MKVDYRAISQQEKVQMMRNGCHAVDWAKVEVSEGFDPRWVREVQFSGFVKLGAFRRVFTLAGGVEVHSGISRVRLHNCIIGDDVYIDRIHNYIANYTIGNDTFIENTNLIVVDGVSTFGNGVKVPVMNEGGGREIPIYDKLSAHLAYILTLYRHNAVLIDRIQSMIDHYVDGVSSSMGSIGSNVTIVNTGMIKNVRVGDYAVIQGVSKLKNGSINSNKEAPICLSSGVKCQDFILCSGVEITDSTLVSRCFVGQGCVMGNHYSALDSLFFANCQGFHGEATAIFAGPYTVSHHKSSLLIAGMFSFLNAGSGSNQSNHMYKLGPIHQGVTERGSKTASDSYLLWPARVGAFTLVMGRHTGHSDTSKLPFSYLIENASESFLIPGVNLRSVGTIRDAQKWPKRDNRKDPNRMDQINFNLLSPYTIQKMYCAIDLLSNLQKASGYENQIYHYQNCNIKNSSLRKGITLYWMAIKKFLGNSLISRLSRYEIHDVMELRRVLKPELLSGHGDWVDISGLIAPKTEIDKLIEQICQGELDLDAIQQRFVELHSLYYDYEWTWAYDKLLRFWDKDIDDVEVSDCITLVEQWKDAVLSLDKMLYDDAHKEFDMNSHTGFGVDGDDEKKQRDFESVRGSFESNPFVCEVMNHIEKKSKLGDDTIAMLKGLL